MTFQNKLLLLHSEKDALDNKDNWTSFELQYNFLDNHFLRLFYGARRWGLNCAGGVCALQPAFEGLEIQLVSSF